MARYLHPMVVRRNTTILGETTRQEARERLLKELSSSAVANTEALLQNRHAELQEKIAQLKRALELPHLPADSYDSITARIEGLESLPIETFLSKKVDLIDGQHRFHATSIWSEMIFVARYVDEKICWRSVQVVVESFETESYVFFTETREIVFTSFIGFSEDSLSHFQNLPVPPPALDRMLSRTQVGFAESLTKGCFVSMTQHISPLEEFGGGLKWIKSRKRLINVLESYGKRLQRYLRDLKSSFANCVTSLESTLNSQRVPSQSYSDSIDVYLMAITLKHFINCFICLFLLQREKIRNRILVDVT